ncbi:hypothetical protein [Petropleomorpha daqingensis]|uniref:Uncharacterized protein n=1 Tax=Petropleomorpha daqingensis TaxID=2026353 RepID=A0A853CI05_9ACTN|nr:hypothetical protein [Petropleomorpha daqingensis]NYJ07585.1 hypothetical protein [Petropleomorpha daqingensis]
MTDLATPRAVEPLHVPEDVEPPPGPTAGVELSRLLALARLTPQQALETGAGVLADAASRSGPAADPGPVAARLEEIAAAARFPGRRPDPATDPLLDELDRAALDLPRVGVAAVARRLAEAAAAIDRDAVRAELAALVAAVPAGARGEGGPARAPSAAARSGRAAPLETTNRGRRVAAWLLSVLVLAAVVLVEVVVLRGKISADVGMLLDAGRGGGRTTSAATSDGPPVRAPAPAAAGSVTRVDLRPLAPCAPGGACTLRLLVRLAPRADPQTVTWSYLLVDRCTGATSTAPGGTVPVAPNGEQAVAVGVVALPALSSVAVVAVTGSPAVAASPPVSVGSCTGTG